MSFRNKSDVHKHLAASRKHYSPITEIPASEPDATGYSESYKDIVADKASETSFVLGKTPKPHIALPQSDEESA